jgi:hypothetical protein
MLWPWKSIEFQTLLRTKYVPSLVKIYWKMLILECWQGCYAVNIWPSDLDLWPRTLKINRVPESLGYSNATVRPSFRPSVCPSHPCEHSRISILQRILTKLVCTFWEQEGEVKECFVLVLLLLILYLLLLDFIHFALKSLRYI